MTHGTLRVSALTKIFNKGSTTVTALENVDIDIAEGEFVSIVGSSGCGKSTLLNILAGLERQSSGQVLVNGRPIAGPGPDRAMVFQSDASFPWLTVKDNLEYGLKVQGRSQAERERVVGELLPLLGLDQFAHAYPRELSGGMRKRIDIGRAYAVEPEILLMDEPFGALDVVTREHMQDELLRTWSARRSTVVFITHDIDEAIMLSDRIVMLSPRPGRVREVVDVPFARPRTPELRETADFYKLRTDLRRMMGEATR
ncbi:ABC transporter ATP-binding protein [Sinosporangium siamense]|uniref:ABC transporter ATP-binding protein n=1 Tax=Sinosporangium siamense TaxID=1367973 RepID=A0A919RF90_9ACTN|nr:ABC transporter ATP-binding protein [Sinosporangium siamense]GII92632.1 ABC transporter ATP-binding protein [Sinosporangium siamense]